MRATDTRVEAARLMAICNACRYCEGHCPVFPAMERRLDFSRGDLDYLANLCHGCAACFHHCQYAEPHEFAVNVPRTFARLRKETYADYAWPAFMRPAFARNGVWVAGVIAASLAGFLVGTAWLAGPGRFTGVHDNGFYGVIPHSVMAGMFTVVGGVILVALVMGVFTFWRALGLPSPLGLQVAAVMRAARDALTLKYLDGGGGDGCTYPTERPSLARRTFHHLTFYGFLLCFGSTTSASIYHYGFDLPAPYGLLSLPKILGVPGGIGLVIGTAGLLWLKRAADSEVLDDSTTGMDVAFLVLLLSASATGLVLMLVSGTGLVGPMLAIHLGIVLALFLSIPYGKFAHVFYRLVALIVFAMEQRSGAAMAGQRPAAGADAIQPSWQTEARS